MKKNPKSTIRKILQGLQIIGALVLVSLILKPSLFLSALVLPLLKEDHPKPEANTKYLFVMMGEPSLRPHVGARAVLDGLAENLVMVECEPTALEEAGLIPKESDMAVQMAQRTGLAPEKIHVIREFGRVTSTAEEAAVISKYLHSVKKSEVTRIVVTTSWFHTRRTHWILSKALQDQGITIEMVAARKPSFSEDNWWQSEAGLLTVFEEYIKWARYIILFVGRELPREPII